MAVSPTQAARRRWVECSVCGAKFKSQNKGQARCSRECFDALDGWDESFFLYSEETEFALRARDRGFLTALVADAEAVHIGGESRVSPALWSLLTVNRVRLYGMRHSRPATALFWSAVFLREASRAALGHPRSRRAVAALVRPALLPFPPSPGVTSAL